MIFYDERSNRTADHFGVTRGRGMELQFFKWKFYISSFIDGNLNEFWECGMIRWRS